MAAKHTEEQWSDALCNLGGDQKLALGSRPSLPCRATTQGCLCTSLDVAGTFYSWQKTPLQHNKEKDDPSYTVGGKKRLHLEMFLSGF